MIMAERLESSKCDVDVMVRTSRVKKDACLSKGLRYALKGALIDAKKGK